MDKIKTLFKSKAFWATAGVIAGAAFGGAGSAIMSGLQTIACTIQTCV